MLSEINIVMDVREIVFVFCPTTVSYTVFFIIQSPLCSWSYIISFFTVLTPEKKVRLCKHIFYYVQDYLCTRIYEIKFLLEFNSRYKMSTDPSICFISSDSKNSLISIFLFLPLLLGNSATHYSKSATLEF